MSIDGPCLICLLFWTILPVSESGLLTGLAAYGICQKGCAALVVACYAAAGFTFGVPTGGAGVPAAVLGCNSAFGACQAGCAAAAAAGAVSPTP